MIPQHFHTDNGSSFTSQGYTDHLKTFSQISSFAGVGAHHENGLCERTIRTVMSVARTMMLHAAIHWPEMADPSQWPMAVLHAVFLYNHAPALGTGLSPHDLFTRTRWPQRKFHDLHVWGCPVYVLDKKISDGMKLPRWSPRSQRMINMGLSSKHSTMSPLVLNPASGAITPQFHVVFDDWFATIATSVHSLPDFNSSAWARMFGESQFQFSDDESDDTPPDDAKLPPLILDHRERVANAMDNHLQGPLPPILTPSDTEQVAPTPSAELLPRRPPTPLVQQRETVDNIDRVEVPEPTEGVPVATPASEEVPVTAPASDQRTSPSPVSRPQRNRRQPDRFGFDSFIESHFSVPSAYTAEFGVLEPVAWKATSDPDTLSWHEAMAADDREEFLKAAELEIKTLEDNETWVEAPNSEAKGRIIPGTWTFKRKRTPDGTISRYKARYCLRGDLMEKVEDTFAPVVAFATVRLFTVLVLTLGWASTTIDYTNAFTQAPLRNATWIHFPRGFGVASSSGAMCLQLKKTLYGAADGNLAFYDHLKGILLGLGFKQSVYDPCLMFRKGVLLVIYCDDVAAACPSSGELDTFVEELKACGCILTQQASLSEYLGIKFDRLDDGAFNLTQCGLIQKILVAAGMEDCRPMFTPASPIALGSDPEGEPMSETWNYRSIVGMLLYLAGNTRPDITMAVSQVCRFSNSPKQSHAKAVKHILRYLKGTADKGMIIRPNGTLGLDNYCDADFAGLYGSEPQENPDSARSRIGYIIFLGDCPLIWKSQLCTEITTSTLHSEYVALSTSLRVQLVLKQMLEEIIENLMLDLPISGAVICRAFEDNRGALLLANNQRLSNRTRHFNVKYHWFWECVKDHLLSILTVGTHQQRADGCTKNLVREPFETIRFLNQGW